MSDYRNMGNEEIGEFCRASHRKLAKDVFAIAKGIQVVHLRLKGTKGEFGSWRQKYLPFLSKATVYRYLAIAELDPAQIGENEGISELYRRLCILPAKPPADSTPTSGQSGTGITTAVAGAAPTPNSEGVEAVDDALPPADEIGLAVPDTDPATSQVIQPQDKDVALEDEEDLREMELAAALVVAGKLAAKYGLSGDSKNLVAFLGEFGVTLGDISALAAA